MFFQWVALYSNLSQNIAPDDREDMMRVWDDDGEFDKWLREMERKRSSKTKKAGPGRTTLSQQEYEKHAKTHGGE